MLFYGRYSFNLIASVLIGLFTVGKSCIPSIYSPLWLYNYDAVVQEQFIAKEDISYASMAFVSILVCE